MNYMDVEQLIEDRRRGMARYDYWRTHRHWTLPQAAYLLLGREPLPNNEAGEYQPGENLLLVMQQYPLPELITPQEAVQWFARSYPMYDLPPELAGLLEESTPLTETPADVTVDIAAWELEDVQPPDSTDRELRYAPELSGGPEAQEPTPATDRAQAARILRNSQPSQVAKDAKYRSLIATATELWTNGDRRNHREMRDFLWSDPQYSELSKNSVLQKLKGLLKGKLNKPELIYNKAT